MSQSYNRCVLMGNVTRAPEVKYLPSGMAVCDVGLAVNDRVKQADGSYKDVPTFVDCTCWSKTAEIAGEYVVKGQPLLIEGKLKMDSWTTADGAKRTKLKVTVDRLVLLGSKSEKPPVDEFHHQSPPGEGVDAPANTEAGDGIPF